MEYQRIPEASYKKLVFQLRGQYMAILNVFRCYGMQGDVDIAIEECVKVAENFGMALRGKDAPIHILDKPKRRALE
uniref:Uncharacterized protein n=1 Tax=viral metagenome TaxID=1070528 RepID=A0A6M3LWY3_9ZZZZ